MRTGWSTITASYTGTCRRCRQSFPAGTRIRYGGRGLTYHLAKACPANAAAADAAADAEARALYRMTPEYRYEVAGY